MNLVDWDYNFNIEKFTKVINKIQYKKWRYTGNAFDFRLSSNKHANRTMSSYVEGKKKGSRDSCMVRGFWGDIINSPYIPLGIYIEDPEDRKQFNREFNLSRPYDAQHVSEYSIMHFLHQF
jgi:dynein assembly factor 3, axonemal